MFQVILFLKKRNSAGLSSQVQQGLTDDLSVAVNSQATRRNVSPVSTIYKLNESMPYVFCYVPSQIRPSR
jgi:hypothetical protein